LLSRGATGALSSFPSRSLNAASLSSQPIARAVATKESYCDSFFAFGPVMSIPSSASDYEYIALIDEAGDPGLSRVRPADPQGSSEWLIVSAVLIRKENENQLDNWYAGMFERLIKFKGKKVHFLRLNDVNKLASCEFLARRPVKIFTVCSNKKNMKGHVNPFAELRSLDRNWFYCWLTRVLLERVTHFVLNDSVNTFGKPKKVKLIYSHRGGLSYSQLSAYFSLIKMQGRVGGLYLELGNVYFETIDMDLVEVIPHFNHLGLTFADISASAFFKACDIYHTNACDPRFAEALKPRVASVDYRDSNEIENYRTYAGYGVKLLPSFKGARMTREQSSIFKSYGYPRQWWDPTPTTLSPFRMATLSPTVALDASDNIPEA